jgi:hypothetical protein
MGKVSNEVAIKDVTAWLDHKKMRESRREEKKEAINSLISLVEDGTLSISDEDFIITQNLTIPVGEINKLEWKPFGQVGKVQLHMKNVESTDFTGNAIANACAQTDQSKNIINKLDLEDVAVLKVIAVFFM